MSQSEEDCIQDLSNAGITAQIKIRTNQSTNRMDNASIQRFKNNQNNLFSGEVDKEGNITVSQIDKNKIRETGKSKKFIRFGEFRTKFSPEEWKTLSGDTKINVKDLSYFRPILSGDIKIREGATPISRLW